MTTFNDFIIARETGDFINAFRMIDNLIQTSSIKEEYGNLAKYYNSKRILFKKFGGTISNKSAKMFIIKKEFEMTDKIKDLYKLSRDSSLLNRYYISKFSSELDAAMNFKDSEKFGYLSDSLESFEKIDKTVLNFGVKSSIYSSISRVNYELGYKRKAFESLDYANDAYNNINMGTINLNIHPTLWISSIYLNYARFYLMENDIINAVKYLKKLNNINDPLRVIEHRKRLLKANIQKIYNIDADQYHI